MPNRYIGQMGIPMSAFEEQISWLIEIQQGVRPAAMLCQVEPKVLRIRCGKNYDEAPTPELLAAVPVNARTALTVGCGTGAIERALQAQGMRVTAFPLDALVGASVARDGVEVIAGSIEDCLSAVAGRQFDCVLTSNLLHLLPRPAAVLERCAELVGPDGVLVVQGRNLDHLPTLIRRLGRWGDFAAIGRFEDSGIHLVRPSTVGRAVRNSGLESTEVCWCNRGWPSPWGALAHWAGRFGARSWVVQARRGHPATAADTSTGRRAMQVQS
jgi:SAM-dependent methyltransferase